MLTLSRKAGESIRIEGAATITIRKTSRSRVVVGIEASADVEIRRGELAAADQPTAEGAADRRGGPVESRTRR
jgi:carbon storage regulator CsrA